MSFLNPALLIGLGLTLIPVVLHLFLRAKPKRLIFPALRLIQQRRRQNVRRIKLRHLWLLLLRIAVIALIVLAICRPSLPAANYSFTTIEWGKLIGIVAAAFAAYFGIMRWWQRRAVSKNELLTRRTVLRGGVGTAAFLLALLSVIWPYVNRVTADLNDTTPHLAENVPVAAVFLFDTSVSMSYKQANKTRLRAAQETAKSHLTHFPSGSKLAVAASGDATPTAFSTDLVAAQSRIDAMDIKSISIPINDRLRTLLLMQEEDRQRVSSEQSTVPSDKRQDRFVREIYIFTDLAKSGWREESMRDELQRLRWVGIYLVDVGEKAPVNVSLTDMKLSREAVPAGSMIRLEASVAGVGDVKPEQTVELYLKSEDGKPVRKDVKSVKVVPGNEARVSFDSVTMPNQPYVQGELRMAGSDPLAADDVLHFTAHTIPTLKVLIVAERPEISYYWTVALKNLADAGISAYQTELATPDQLADRDLNAFDVICLINANKPSDAAWTKLRAFVDGGGGLAVFLGANTAAFDYDNKERINPLAYRSEAAASVLPATLVASLQHKTANTMDLRKSQHPLLKRFEELGSLAELGDLEVRRYWKVEPIADAGVITRYIGAAEDEPAGPPAMLERRIGQGRVVMLTTSVDAKAWNDLLSSPIYIVFVDQITQYLAWQASGKFNHQVGDEVALPIGRDQTLSKVIVRMPDFKQRAMDIPPQARFITLRDMTSVGSYSVDSADRSINYHVGFSLNLPASESDLTRLQASDLDKILGEKRYRVTDQLQDLERDVSKDRLGQEMYGMVLAFLVAVFALEQFTATWFYRTDES